ncbi:MAG: hypothetical protein H7Z75_05130 [Ferruginibacter sp.]|nr:hypothetical protein [Cytophagales bacterium]
MNPTQVITFLERIRRAYVVRKALVCGAQSLGGGVLATTIAHRCSASEPLAAAIGLAVAVAGWALLVSSTRIRQTSLADVALHLDRSRPELEQSCGLLLKPTEQLTRLEHLQVGRVRTALATLGTNSRRSGQLVPVSLRRVGWLPLVCLLAALAVGFAPVGSSGPAAGGTSFRPNAAHAIGGGQRPLPRVQRMEIEVVPPAYTRQKSYFASHPDLKVPQESRIRWKITTSQPVDSIAWVLNDHTRRVLRTGNPPSGVFAWEQSFAESGFYHLEVDHRKSDLYALEIIPDAPPEIQVRTPEPYVEIAFGDPSADPRRVGLRATLSDDYGIRDARLVATVVMGSGEAVKFREETIPLHADFRERKTRYVLRETLDPIGLGMTWGDELYFYLQTWDNHRGYARSETYFVRMADTTTVANGNDLTAGVNPMPEYFRSQRQIIIDTENLLKEQRVLTKEEAGDRANAIGMDQRLLRLRYGKFLGEEAESGVGEIAGQEELAEGHDEHDGHDHGATRSRPSPALGGNAADVVAPYSHRHDSEEGATYLEPAVKATLKASLAQMWEAELRLRTHQPRAALPFEYRALKLLKEVQQSSRAYVKKTGFDPPPIKPGERRLKGDLSKVQAVRNREDRKREATFPATRQALRWIARQRESAVYQPEDAALLEKAGQELAREALRTPGQYLAALRDLRKLINENPARQPCPGCLATVEKALWQLLPPATPAPTQLRSQRNRLGEAYFRRLQ